MQCNYKIYKYPNRLLSCNKITILGLYRI